MMHLRNWLLDVAILVVIAAGIATFRACTDSTPPPPPEPWDVPNSVPAYTSVEPAASCSVSCEAVQDWHTYRQNMIRTYMARYGISEDLTRLIHDVAISENLEPELSFRLVRTESSFRPDAVSSAGAIGLTQILPSTARWLSPGVERVDLFESETNLRLGFRYLQYLLDRHRGNVRRALLSYNMGPNRVARIVMSGGSLDNGYADRVLAE